MRLSKWKLNREISVTKFYVSVRLRDPESRSCIMKNSIKSGSIYRSQPFVFNCFTLLFRWFYNKRENIVIVVTILLEGLDSFVYLYPEKVRFLLVLRRVRSSNEKKNVNGLRRGFHKYGVFTFHLPCTRNHSWLKRHSGSREWSLVEPVHWIVETQSQGSKLFITRVGEMEGGRFHLPLV